MRTGRHARNLLLRWWLAAVLCLAIGPFVPAGEGIGKEREADESTAVAWESRVVEMIERWLLASGEDPDLETLEEYAAEALAQLQQVLEEEGIPGVEAYLEVAEAQLAAVESGEIWTPGTGKDRIWVGAKSCDPYLCCGQWLGVKWCENCKHSLCVAGHTGMCTGCDPGQCGGYSNFECFQGFQGGLCPCMNVTNQEVCTNDECITGGVRPNYPGMTGLLDGPDTWSCLIPKQDCGCDYGCYETLGEVGPEITLHDTCTNEYADCGNNTCFAPGAWEGATCEIILPCLEVIWPLGIYHCRGYYGVWDTDDTACVTCNGARQGYKLADTSKKCIDIANGGDCIDINWEYQDCVHEQEGPCEAACGADAVCDEKSPGESCGTKACPEDVCVGNVLHDYPDTCTRTCNGDCSCDCTCTAETYACDNGDFCDGQEICHMGVCLGGNPPCADDGLYCNGQESCDEGADQCVSSGDPCADDGLYCNGQESCDEGADQCVSSGDPCADSNDCTGDACDEGEDLCTYACVAVDWQDPCCEDPVCAGEEVCTPPGCMDLDGDGFGDPADPACPDPRLDCEDDPAEDPAGCDLCDCGTAACAGCARCVHPDAAEFPDDAFDSNCNGNLNCFIATAAFGSRMDPKIVRLRAFRDRHLMNWPAGERFVEMYYTYSPPVAETIAEHEWLRLAVRILLYPVVGVVQVLF